MSGQIATNKKAFRDYFIIEKWECGIVLEGSEVKSLREAQVNFKDSFARLEDQEVFLHNLYIPPYSRGTYLNPNPDRIRKLLLKKKEISKLIGAVTQKGLTLIPTKIYFNRRGLAKVELALARGKKQYDKRDTIKTREIEKTLKRAVKGFNKK